MEEKHNHAFIDGQNLNRLMQQDIAFQFNERVKPLWIPSPQGQEPNT